MFIITKEWLAWTVQRNMFNLIVLFFNQVFHYKNKDEKCVSFPCNIYLIKTFSPVQCR